MKEVIYKIIDFLTLGKGLTKTFQGYKLRLPTRYINYFPAGYEDENFQFLKANIKPGDVVFDIGAHIGFFANLTAMMMGKKGKVYAFEPTPSTFEMMKQFNATNKNSESIIPVNMAVGKEEGFVTFYISDDKIDNTNSALGYRDNSKHKPINIPLTSIDAFASKNNISSLHFIKIDVEGFEYDALLGGMETLKKFKPAVILSIHPHIIAEKGDRMEDIYDAVVTLGYTVYRDNKPVTRNGFIETKELIDLHLIPAR